MKQTYFTLFLFFLFSSLHAQYSEVKLDFESSYIGENNPLPSEQNLLFSGSIPSYVDRIEFQILPSRGKKQRDPLHTAVWVRPLGNEDATYSLPVNYKLRPSAQYDIRVEFFTAVEPAQREQLINRSLERLLLYLDSQQEPNARGVEWNKRPKRLIEGMQELMEEDLADYRPQPGAFSELVRLRLEKMEELKVRKDSSSQSALMQEKALLTQLLQSELPGLLPERMYRLADQRYLEDCPAESKKGMLSINAGYGGVYLSGDFGEDFHYDSAPYVGLSFPLGNQAFAPRFFSNTYLGFGVFLDNLESANGKERSGPVIGRPIYASLDYKLFQFVYLNAGATLLEDSRERGQGSVLLVRPFLGLSAKINLSLSFDR